MRFFAGMAVKHIPALMCARTTIASGIKASPKRPRRWFLMPFKRRPGASETINGYYPARARAEIVGGLFAGGRCGGNLESKAKPGQILTKDSLIEAAWRDVAVTDNSLEQAVSGLRRLLGAEYIETHARRGYRFAADVREGAFPAPEHTFR